MSNPRRCLRFKLPLAEEKRGRIQQQCLSAAATQRLFQHRDVEINLTDITGAARLGAGISSEVSKDAVTSWAKWGESPGGAS